VKRGEKKGIPVKNEAGEIHGKKKIKIKQRVPAGTPYNRLVRGD